MDHGRCVTLKKGQLWLDEDKFRNNHLKILTINTKKKTLNVAYLDDAGIFGFNKKGIQDTSRLYERPVSKKTYSFNKFENMNMELIS